MPKLDRHKPERKPVCVGCNDTGKASNGQPCYPCLANGRVKPAPAKPAPKPELRDLFD